MMLQRTIVLHLKPAPTHRARDPTDLADPLLRAMIRAERQQARPFRTPEQTLAQVVLAMRLIDAAKK